MEPRNKESAVKNIQSKLKTHVFVCTNKKASGACCEPKGGAEVRKELKAWVDSHPEWNKKIRINQSGCLDHCDNGVAVAIYPQTEFLIDVSPNDLTALKEKITKLMNA